VNEITDKRGLELLKRENIEEKGAEVRRKDDTAAEV
jgi:hypothetical protein